MKPKNRSIVIGGAIWCLFFVSMGFFFLCLGGSINLAQQDKIANYESAEATVTKWIPDPDIKAPDWCPVYEYVTKKGEKHSFTGQSCVGKPDPATVGKMQEQIYYDPTNPYTQVIEKDHNAGSWLLGFGIVMAIFFSLFGVIPFSIIIIRWIKQRNTISNG